MVNGLLLLLLGVALGCAALALWLWQLAAQRARRQAAMRLLGARGGAGLLAAQAEPVRPRAGAPAPSAVAATLRRLDLPLRMRSVLLLAAPVPAVALVVTLLARWEVGLLALLLGVVLGAIALGLRRAWVRQRLQHALPGFVDAMVRMIVLGQSPGASFLGAVQGIEGPLRRALEHAEALVAAGLDVDAALTQVGRVYGSEPLLLLGAVMRMSTQYGGRVDQVLERMAAFLRDREEAQQELLAVSAETRMSAWVLGSLPVGVTVLILFANSTYLAGMWNDAGGRQLLAGAFLLELLGAFLLYRLTRFR